jgi:hypothetical protein
MKKILLLTLTLVLALSVDAQTTYRKSWDFTKWSSETVANLMAGLTLRRLTSLSQPKHRKTSVSGKLLPQESLTKTLLLLPMEA